MWREGLKRVRQRNEAFCVHSWGNYQNLTTSWWKIIDSGSCSVVPLFSNIDFFSKYFDWNRSDWLAKSKTRLVYKFRQKEDLFSIMAQRKLLPIHFMRGFLLPYLEGTNGWIWVSIFSPSRRVVLKESIFDPLILSKLLVRVN